MEPSVERKACVCVESREESVCVWRVERKACVCVERDSEGGLGET